MSRKNGRGSSIPHTNGRAHSDNDADVEDGQVNIKVSLLDLKISGITRLDIH